MNDSLPMNGPVNGRSVEDEDEDDPSRKGARRARRLSRRLRQAREGELNIVSMIDVFAVLVFFLLVTSSITAARLNILALDLPTKAVATAAPPVPHPSVSLLENALLVDSGSGDVRRLAKSSTGYDLETLSALMLAAKQKTPKQDSADLLVAPDVAYADVVAVMDAMRQRGSADELFPHVAIGEAADDGVRP